MSTLFKREEAVKKISNSLALLELSTRNLGLMRLFDQNIVAESFSAELLNLVYGYELINLNSINNTYAATDLGDFANRLCFQVTYTGKQNHRTKIQDSLNKFVILGMHRDFDRCCFLFLGPKQKTYSTPFETNGKIPFDPYKDVFNLEDIVKKLPNLTDSQLDDLVTLVESKLQFQGINSSPLSINNFSELAQEIWPLIANNGRAFTSFGPNSGADTAANLRWDLELWENAKVEIILPNNRKILQLITDHGNLIPDRYRAVFDKMIAHIYAFEKHCEDPTFSYTDHQFPTLFGKIIDETCVREERRKGNVAQYEKWLSEWFQESTEVKILDAYIVGSALRGHFAGADVDLFILTGINTTEESKALVSTTENLKEDFLLKFGKPLHVMVFSVSEKGEYYNFLENVSRKKQFSQFKAA
ncbi:MAG: SMEK domain-containing protein [Anaerolineae bacterium]|nr:SMEK domain-containing protein [Anaerolineae bacterium]